MSVRIAPATIPISALQLGPEVEELVLSVLRSGRLAQGPMVERFERLCCEMADTAHAVAVSNGTVALEAALEVCDVQPGDEVITAPFTFAATINAILRRGAVVRFADITTDFTVDPESVAALIGPRTAALMPVHLFGLMADMESLSVVAERHGLALIEDAAQAHGAEQHGRRAGSYGVGSFSFYATKNVTAGEGGCVTTNDRAIAERLRVLRHQGMRERYQYVAIGLNWRMTDVAAAIAIPQLQRLAERNEQRRHNAARLSALLGADGRVVVPRIPAGRTHVWHQYTVLLPEGCDRNAVVSAMAREGVQTGVYYPRLVWDYPPYRNHPDVHRSDTPFAAAAAERCLSLPVHPALDEHDLERVAAALTEALPS